MENIPDSAYLLVSFMRVLSVRMVSVPVPLLVFAVSMLPLPALPVAAVVVSAVPVLVLSDSDPDLFPPQAATDRLTTKAAAINLICFFIVDVYIKTAETLSKFAYLYSKHRS